MGLMKNRVGKSRDFKLRFLAIWTSYRKCQRGDFSKISIKSEKPKKMIKAAKTACTRPKEERGVNGKNSPIASIVFVTSNARFCHFVNKRADWLITKSALVCQYRVFGNFATSN